jgi:hypothetical protein
MADTPHKPLKLPSNPNPYLNLHRRTHSAHSNTGYISEVSEFSFDRVTVNTAETPMTGVSSNVSWNFFEETKDLISHAAKKDSPLGFVPYTGGTNDKSHGNGQEHADARDGHPSVDNSTGRHLIKINMDNISLSDRSNELPISGIVDSNQSIISEISDVNMDNDEINDAVRKHLHGKNGTPTTVTSKEAALDLTKKKATPPSSPKHCNTPTSLNYSDDPSKSSPSILREFNAYKFKRMQYNQQQQQSNGASVKQNGNDAGNTAKEEDKNVLESILGNIRIGLGFCTWYLCGTDTTDINNGEMLCLCCIFLPYRTLTTTINGNLFSSLYSPHITFKGKELTKEERQREMDATFLGKMIFCNCHNSVCAKMTSVL